MDKMMGYGDVTKALLLMASTTPCRNKWHKSFLYWLELSEYYLKQSCGCKKGQVYTVSVTRNIHIWVRERSNSEQVYRHSDPHHSKFICMRQCKEPILWQLNSILYMCYMCCLLCLLCCSWFTFPALFKVTMFRIHESLSDELGLYRASLANRFTSLSSFDFIESNLPVVTKFSSLFSSLHVQRTLIVYV